MKSFSPSRLLPIVRSVRKAGVMLGLIGAIVMAGGAVTASFFVPTKALGVFLSAVGCFAAGWMFSAFFAKAIGLAKEDGMSAKNLEEELAKTKEAKVAADNHAAELEAENARLRNQRIDVNAVRPVLKLGLMDARMSVTDVDVGRWLNDFDSGSLISSAKRSQYVGVLRRSFKATYGVDLAKLLVREDSDCLRIAGITTESLGFKDVKTEWLVRQIQTYSLKSTSETEGGSMPAANPTTGFKGLDRYYEIDRKAGFTGTLDRDRTSDLCENQENELSDRLEKGVGEEFRTLNSYIREMAEGFVRILLAPVHKPVVFVETPLAQIKNEVGWLALEEFANGFNKEIDSVPAAKGMLE